MGDKNKKELFLEGLCCANCAAKIEREANKISGVDKATVDFVSKKLIVNLDHNSDFNRILNEAANIVKMIEPEVKVINREDTKAEKHHSHEDSDEGYKEEIFKIAVGLVLFFSALYFKFPEKIEFTLFLVSYLIVGGEILLRAIKNILRGQVFDENFLMSIATVGAFAIGEFPEGVAVMLFYQIGELFQDMAVKKSRKSISELMDIRPDYANLKIDNDIKRVSPEEIKVGDIIVVKPGEKIPLDGRVLEGKSMLDTSALTGESVPREVEAGASVLSGFINKNGVLSIQVEKVFKDSTVAKILDLVENASSRKAPTENFITKFARYYTPAVVITALILSIIPPLLIQGATFQQWIYRALVFLVVSCPCALVVSIPLGFFGGIGGASKNGILVKGGNYLEALNQVDTVVFDKTGTLTKGVFKVTEIKTTGAISKDDLLEYAAFAEAYSNHPIGLSILEAYGKDINRSEIKGYNEIPGKGIRIKLKENEVAVGNAKLMKEDNISFNEVDAIGTIVYVAVDKVYCGYIVISDEIKEDSKAAIDILKEMGIKKIIMLTGDSKLAAEAVGKRLGIEKIYSELLPGEKVEKLEMMDTDKNNKGKIIFVGDGINDAPVLARADIGIAMGGVGSDAAIEAADVVIMTDEPSKIATAVKISKRTKSIVLQNIIFALGVKLVVLLLGALGFANMWEAVFADVGVAVIAILNSMRALKTQ
ncbi:cadmium, zinc and cobalt-transporting ATPase [Clostridium homopropionicum DSM 5847]|uniref:Cadmium, zinc and cobalt-transporting ATPase n=1 Tax=Clostridium homopropionicum DSM 5847 TaxID=1121318 RepID=A0A0L6Z9V0_9CLOT|nr:heavy metal translocating P-type ATPase [Clostridium homopropionicum]KOA19737.1 cadmium, zinc and cobalt-transporting ATPase [Clostridium homopropionicum DSM 5847]SFF78653.1 Cd2+/Zn2+-exporting ATPase [Clostridium homopropionicum]